MTLLTMLIATAIHTLPCASGSWITSAGGQPIFGLKIAETHSGPAVTWTRPEQFEFDGESFSEITGPAITRSAVKVRQVKGGLEASFDDPAPGATSDIFNIRCAAPGHIEVNFSSFEPFDFVRISGPKSEVGGWDRTRTYTRVIDRHTSTKMTAIFTADQADREHDRSDWTVIALADEKRRQQTQMLLDAGSLRSGDDFYHAAFVFQHGRSPDDYLKAHVLAIVAVARGNPGAVWIASATLDRYLHAIGRAQILGTQFKALNGSPVTQEPYDRHTVSDALRAALHVPSLSEQERQKEEYAAPASKNP